MAEEPEVCKFENITDGNMRIRLLSFILWINLTAVMGQPRAVITEDFSALTRDWPTDESRSIKDGVYAMKSSEDGAESFISFFIDYQKEFVLSADIVFQNGADDSAFGLSWGTGTEDYNVFLLTPDGQFVVFGGNLNQIKGWKKSAAIRPGGQINQLKVVSNPAHISFYINDQKVEEHKPMLGYGAFSGVLVLSQAQLTVDNFVFRQDQLGQQARERYLGKFTEHGPKHQHFTGG